MSWYLNVQGMKQGGNRAVLFHDVQFWDEQLLKETYKGIWKISAMCMVGFEVWTKMMMQKF